MELRHLRYFAAVGEEQHYGRAAQRLRVAQPALSRQIQDLEDEVGFKLFERLPRGVRLSAAGKLFLEDARRILQQVNEAAARAARVARGQSGTLRVGFTENASWHGVVPDSLRRFRERQPDAELQLYPAGSVDQVEAIRSGRVTDLNMPLPMALAWRKDNTSPLLATFIADVSQLPDVQALAQEGKVPLPGDNFLKLRRSPSSEGGTHEWLVTWAWSGAFPTLLRFGGASARRRAAAASTAYVQPAPRKPQLPA